MSVIPMNYAHLPISLAQYETILQLIDNDMFVGDLDSLIHVVRGTKLRHHYRGALKRLKLIIVKGDKIFLPRKVEEYKDGLCTIFDLLNYICTDHDEMQIIFRMINSVIGFDRDKPITIIVNELKELYHIKRPKDLRRVLSPLITLGKISGFIPESDYYMYFLRICQETCLEFVTFGDSVPIRKLEEVIYDKFEQFEEKGILYYFNKMYDDSNLRYKIAFITFPDWATMYKGIELNGGYYTHLKIYKSLLL